MIILDLRDGLTEDTVIWKYYNFSSFVNLLMDRNLVFRRVDLFADKLEGTLSALALNEFHKQLLTKTDSVDAKVRVEREAKNVENFKKFTYANCWTINDNENYALWKIYLNPEKNGLAVKTTIKNLKESICFSSSDMKVPQTITIKDVSYVQLRYNKSNQDKVFTTKNPEYIYESELRLLIKNQRDWNNKRKLISEGFNDMPVIYINVDLNKMIDTLFISPFSEVWFQKTVEKLLNLKGINFDISKLSFSQIKE